MKPPHKPMLKIKDLGAPFRAGTELGIVVLKTPGAFVHRLANKEPRAK